MVHSSETDLDCDYEKNQKSEEGEQTEKKDNNVVEDILIQLSFGKFQILNYGLVALVLFAFGMHVMVYLFTALNSEYR